MSKERKKLEKQLDELWRAAVLKRDKNKCRICSKNSGVQAHHIFSRVRRATRWELDNGIALCGGHHFLAHRDFERFRRFVISLIGEKRYDELYNLSLQSVKWTLSDLEKKKKELENFLKEVDGSGEESKT
jgi:predicted restriction endonuclease